MKISENIKNAMIAIIPIAMFTLAFIGSTWYFTNAKTEAIVEALRESREEMGDSIVKAFREANEDYIKSRVEMGDRIIEAIEEIGENYKNNDPQQ